MSFAILNWKPFLEISEVNVYRIFITIYIFIALHYAALWNSEYNLDNSQDVIVQPKIVHLFHFIMHLNIIYEYDYLNLHLFIL